MLPVTTVGKDDGSGSFIAPAPVSGIGLSQNTEFVSDDATTTTTKKVRKPYTIKKTRESWSEQEHEKFIESLQLFDRDWKKIEAFVGSKTVIQIRSHAQKYFLKIQKDGTNDHIPPPRPKRKAAHPYPQKASKNDNRGHVGSSKNAPNKNFCSSSGKDFTDDWGHVGSSKNAPNKNFYSSSGKDDWGHVGSSKNAPNKNFCSSSGKGLTDDWGYVGSSKNAPNKNCCSSSGKEFTDDWGHVGSSKNAPNKNGCSSSGSPSETWPISETSEQIRNIPANRAIPDFVQVHQFIGSVLDPDTEDNHMETLKQMESIDVETVLLLMKNLTVNLENPDFEEHRKLLSYYSDQMQ